MQNLLREESGVARLSLPHQWACRVIYRGDLQTAFCELPSLTGDGPPPVPPAPPSGAGNGGDGADEDASFDLFDLFGNVDHAANDSGGGSAGGSASGAGASSSGPAGSASSGSGSGMGAGVGGSTAGSGTSGSSGSSGGSGGSGGSGSSKLPAPTAAPLKPEGLFKALLSRLKLKHMLQLSAPEKIYGAKAPPGFRMLAEVRAPLFLHLLIIF